MNYSIIFYIIGWILNLEAAFMLLPCMTSRDLRGKIRLCLSHYYGCMRCHWNPPHVKKTQKKSLLHKRRVCRCRS